MIRKIVIQDMRGRRILGSADLPLRIGAGPESDIRIGHADAGETFALVGLGETHLFVQPGGDSAGVLHNGRVLRESRWLENGDVLSIAGSQVRCEASDGEFAFVVDSAIAPPAHPPGSAPAPAQDAPGEQRRAPGVPARAPLPGRRRLLTGLASIVFLALVVVAGFVFMATPVSIQVTPSPDSLSVEGALPEIEIGGRRLLIPGEYRIRASKDGYHALDARVRIESGGERSLDYTLEKLPGRVTIVVRPEVAASVRVDGEALGTTPLEEVEVAAGVHELVISADRYAPHSMSVEVLGGGERQSFEVTLSPLWAVVSIDSRPAGASVLLDGREIGVTPFETEFMQGSYALTLTHDGYDDLTTSLEVVANQPRALPLLQLIESDARLVVESTPSAATVSVDGAFSGRTPLELSLAPRTPHTVEISKSGYETSERQVELEPDAIDRLEISLAPRYGTLLITTVPVDAVLYVDGRRHGPATGRLQLTTRAHALTIRKPGYEDFNTTVTPRAGVVQALDVKLMTPAEAEAAARKPLITTSEGQTLKLLEGSRFQMGASRRAPGRRANENLRDVQITRPYYLGIKEVSNAEYRRFAPDHDSGTLRGKSLDGATQPVADVTWEDAVRYLNWLSARDGLPPAYRADGESFVPVSPPTIGYRLPTEAEWAFAARYASNPQGTEFPWGATFPPNGSAGNYADTSAATLLANTLVDYVDGYPVSAPVASFAPNAAGFFDLGGNVAEWCQDFYSVHASSTGKLAMDPVGPGSGRHRVVRGSSWRHSGIGELRLSYRDYSEKARNDLGFRIARYAE